MLTKRNYAALWTWLLPVLFLASCDTVDTLETLPEPAVSLRLYEVVEDDTTLAGTFSLASEQAFDLSRTAQKPHPLPAPLLSASMHGPFAPASVPEGNLFALGTFSSRPPLFLRVATRSPEQPASKHDEGDTGLLDKAALYLFLLERPNVSLPESIEITYDFRVRTEADTLRFDVSLDFSSTNAANIIRQQQMDIARYTALNLTPRPRQLLLRFEGVEGKPLDDRLVPCLVIHHVGREDLAGDRNFGYCAHVYRDDTDEAYSRVDIRLPFIFSDATVFRFLLLRKPADDA